MNLDITVATAGRVLTQLRRDHRTMALLVLLPVILLGLLRWIYIDSDAIYNRVGPALLGVLPFTVMFLITSIATLRERTSGTLERLLTLPMAKADLLFGYGLAFAVAALVQAVVASAVAVLAYDLDPRGPVWGLTLVAVAVAILGSASGLFVSAFARTEFQAVQFMPAIVLPQFLLCGLLVPRDQLDGALNPVSDLLPLSYAVDAMNEVTLNPVLTAQLALDLGVVLGCALLALLGAAATLRRRTP